MKIVISALLILAATSWAFAEDAGGPAAMPFNVGAGHWAVMSCMKPYDIHAIECTPWLYVSSKALCMYDANQLTLSLNKLGPSAQGPLPRMLICLPVE